MISTQIRLLVTRRLSLTSVLLLLCSLNPWESLFADEPSPTTDDHVIPSRNLESASNDDSASSKKQSRLSLEKTESTIQSSSKESISIRGGSWSISHTQSESGSFMLVRNDGLTENGQEEFQLSFRGDVHEIHTRETRIWDCREQNEDTIAVIRTSEGELVAKVRLRCGDALYVTPHQTYETESLTISPKP